MKNTRGLRLIDVSVSVYLHRKKKGCVRVHHPFFDLNIESDTQFSFGLEKIYRELVGVIAKFRRRGEVLKVLKL